MKYTAKMGSGAMIHIQRFMKTGSVIQKLMGVGGHYDTDTQAAW
jgi:hypothetical protein